MGASCCKVGHSELLESTPPDEETLHFLSQVALFKRLPQELHPTLASLSRKVMFENGQVVIRQGDEGNEFFVIMKGTAQVDIDGKTVATLKSGDYFGETALLRDEPRTATITAASQVHALRITREQFRRLGLQEKLEFAKRGAVGGGNKEIEVKAPTPKTPADRSMMAEALKKNANLTTMVELNEPQLNALIDIAWQESVAPGTEIIRQGDLDADYFYIVKTGNFEVFVAQDGNGKSAEQAASAVGNIPAGGSFGELALLYFAPRAATVKAQVASSVWVIDRNNFKKILTQSSGQLAKRNAGHLKKVPVLSSLKEDECLEVAKALLESNFKKGETIYQQGETGEMFYLLVSGSVSLMKDDKEHQRLAATTDSAAFFGEKALLKKDVREFTVKVTSETVQTLCLDKASFELLLGPLEDINKRGSSGQSKVGHKAKDSSSAGAGSRHGNIRKKDLKRLGLLGCGGFGAVELVEHVKTGDTYALKALSKGYIVKSGMQQSVISEKKVQLLCDSPFVVKLFETFNGDQSLYFLLELALGGELYATYNKKDFYGKEQHAKFYVAGVVFAFDHMHERKIIFRDLKPENLLLNEKGHIKITDMGLAKICAGKTFTTCGTPDYFAPELVQSQGHTWSLDWWTLGILTFELLVGRPPFESPSPMQIYQKVVKGINKVNFPKKAKGPAEDLIKGLCRHEPSERLPMKKGGIENIQKHAWYNGFDWEAMKNLTMTPPYLPQVKSKKDIANFSARKEDMPPHVLYKDNGSGWDKDFATSS